MRKIILDCDPGMDDSMAIVMACKSEALELLAVTAVHGNYPVDVTSKNARKVLEMLGRTDIPAAAGMARPIARPSPEDPFTHGADGQAGANLPEPAMPLDERHAVDLIIDMVKANPGEVTLVATGPLSNIAMALLKNPEITPLVKEIIAISGMFGLNSDGFANATGDTPQSEWNVYVDPEAAEIVYGAGIPFTALGLDVATRFAVDFSDDDIQALTAGKRPEAAFLANAIRFVRGRGFGAYCAVIDCLAVACAADRSLVQTFKGHVGVETRGALTLGMTVLDARHHHVWTQLPQIEIGKEVDYVRFLQMVMRLVLA